MPAPDRRFACLVVVTYVALALCYNALTPIGEAPDEMAHFQYIHLLVHQHRLPGARDNFWQGHQAPLYYLAQAAWRGVIRAVAWCPLDAARLPTSANPAFKVTPDLNYLRHSATERLGGWTCVEWTYHLLRLLSTAFTAGTIALTFAMLREVAPGSPALVAVAGTIAALLPSHVAISAMLNNDVLVNLLAVATTWRVLVARRTGDGAALAQAAILASAAAATKLSGLYLFGLVLLAIALRPDAARDLLRPGRPRRWLIAAVAATAMPLAVALRNLREWGDPFAVAALEATVARLIADGHNPPGRGILHYYLVDVREMFHYGSVVAFGAVNFRDVAMPSLAWGFVRAAVAGLGISALVRSPWRAVQAAPFVVLAVGFALFFATYLVPGYRYRFLQVRFFWSQLPFLSLLAAIGYLALWRAPAKLGVRLPDAALVALAYVYMVGMNALVLATGVVPHLYRYVGASG